MQIKQECNYTNEGFKCILKIISMCSERWKENFANIPATQTGLRQQRPVEDARRACWILNESLVRTEELDPKERPQNRSLFPWATK